MFLHMVREMVLSEKVLELGGIKRENSPQIISNRFTSVDLLFVTCYRAVILRGRGWGFLPATKNVAPRYFHWKIEEK